MYDIISLLLYYMRVRCTGRVALKGGDLHFLTLFLQGLLLHVVLLRTIDKTNYAKSDVGNVRIQGATSTEVTRLKLTP